MITTSLLTLMLAASPVRVAVLPFDNATTDPELEAARGGLADLLASDLSNAEALTVVERSRFAEVVKELELQRTKYFDPKQTVKVGKALGATHVVAGTLVAVAPRLKVSVRVIDVKRGELVANTSVLGSTADLFELEDQLVKQLVVVLATKLDGTRAGHMSLTALGAYARGLDLADQGDLEAAKSKLAEVVRASPDFALAKAQYAEVLKRLKEAQKKRGAALDTTAQTLVARLTPLLGKPPVARALGARSALASLAVLELSRLVGGKRDVARWVPPARRAEAARLEALVVTHLGALVMELRATRGQDVVPELSDEDRALAEQAFGLTDLDLGSPTSLACDVGSFLSSGWTPYRSDVPQFAVRPSPAQRSADQLAAALKWFDFAEKELVAEKEHQRVGLAARVANERAELLVLLGRREEAVAHWQGFLDAYPAADEFPVFTKKVEALMLLDDDAERDERALKACDVGLLERGAELAKRTWRAKGRAGLEVLGASLRACAKRDPKFERASWVLPAGELARVADCEGHDGWKSKAPASIDLGPCL